jgi:Ni/Fe-hydrogenase subunit HybB-like protein
MSITWYEVVMLEKALKGSYWYWGWILLLLGVMGIGFIFYMVQFFEGLKITGMSRDVSWGFYIGQFTYLVGVAASGVMVVLPYYLHDYKAFGRITILGEFMAVAAIVMCGLFIIVDMGYFTRVLNILIYPNPTSILFYDMIALNGYLVLNIIIGWNVLGAERRDMHYPSWVTPLIYLSIPWAFSIHTVTAFLYAGLPGRHSWLTAIMAARFLASAFCSGPAILILVCFIVRSVTKFDPGRKQIQTLASIVTYAMILNVFFFILELFTAFYSQIPGEMETITYLYRGLEGHAKLVPLMWTGAFFALVSLVVLIVPGSRRSTLGLIIGCISVFIATWIDKGFGLVVGGFIPDPFNKVFEYSPTIPELIIGIGVWAVGVFVLSVLFKVAISVKEEVMA